MIDTSNRPVVRILIDANIYLDLYCSKDLRALMNTLPTLEGLFVSQQIVNEVTRNRFRVAATSMKEHYEKLKYASLAFPDELIGGFSEAVSKDIQKFNEAAKALRSSLAPAIANALTAVMEGTDRVSTLLAKKVFRHASSPTDEELARARLRRELGAPPGKSEDPLGDQLTWEQFLSRCAGATHVFVVTRDGDYAHPWNGGLFLNPALRSDVRAIAPSASVAVFDKLASAIPALAKVIGKSVVVPTQRKLVKALQAEEAAESLAKRLALLQLSEMGDARLLALWEDMNPGSQSAALANAMRYPPKKNEFRSLSEFFKSQYRSKDAPQSSSGSDGDDEKN